MRLATSHHKINLMKENEVFQARDEKLAATRELRRGRRQQSREHESSENAMAIAG